MHHTMEDLKTNFRKKVGELLSLLNIVTQTKAERDEDAVVQAV